MTPSIYGTRTVNSAKHNVKATAVYLGYILNSYIHFCSYTSVCKHIWVGWENMFLGLIKTLTDCCSPIVLGTIVYISTEDNVGHLIPAVTQSNVLGN